MIVRYAMACRSELPRRVFLVTSVQWGLAARAFLLLFQFPKILSGEARVEDRSWASSALSGDFLLSSALIPRLRADDDHEEQIPETTPIVNHQRNIHFLFERHPPRP